MFTPRWWGVLLHCGHVATSSSDNFHRTLEKDWNIPSTIRVWFEFHVVVSFTYVGISAAVFPVVDVNQTQSVAAARSEQHPVFWLLWSSWDGREWVRQCVIVAPLGETQRVNNDPCETLAGVSRSVLMWRVRCICLCLYVERHLAATFSLARLLTCVHWWFKFHELRWRRRLLLRRRRPVVFRPRPPELMDSLRVASWFYSCLQWVRWLTRSFYSLIKFLRAKSPDLHLWIANRFYLFIYIPSNTAVGWSSHNLQWRTGSKNGGTPNCSGLWIGTKLKTPSLGGSC